MSRDDGERLADIDDAVRAIQSYAREGAAAGPVSDTTRDAILFRFVGREDVLAAHDPSVKGSTRSIRWSVASRWSRRSRLMVGGSWRSVRSLW